MKNEKLQLIIASLQYSHPHYLGQDFDLSIQYDRPNGFDAIFFMQDAYKTFISEYTFEVFAAVARLYNVSVSIKVRQGLPVVCMYDGTYY